MTTLRKEPTASPRRPHAPTRSPSVTTDLYWDCRRTVRSSVILGTSRTSGPWGADSEGLPREDGVVLEESIDRLGVVWDREQEALAHVHPLTLEPKPLIIVLDTLRDGLDVPLKTKLD